LVRNITQSDDWRASAWMLERNVAREEFRQEAAQEKLVIEINVSRDQAIAAKHGVIDVTPEVVDGQVVPGLPAKP
jgi:phosphosulfolactate phosphohydrolase-like enzyme